MLHTLPIKFSYSLTSTTKGKDNFQGRRESFGALFRDSNNLSMEWETWNFRNILLLRNTEQKENWKCWIKYNTIP